MLTLSTSFHPKGAGLDFPSSRSKVEAACYLAVLGEPAVWGRMPALLKAEADWNPLFLEKQHSGDLTAAGSAELIDYLIAAAPELIPVFRNREMRCGP